MIAIESLLVIGYATSLSDEMLPTVVTPVFQVSSDADRTLVPPFRIRDGKVHGACVVGQREREDLARREEITLLDTAVAALDRHELWIDSDRIAHYEPKDRARAELRRLAKAALDEGERLLEKRELERADRLASAARAADPSLVESMAMKAAIRRWRGEHVAVETIAQIAKSSCPALEASFYALAERYLSVIRRAK